MKALYRVLSPFLCVLVAAVFGWLVWQFSIPITGEIEPWDSQTGYYSISMITLGFVSAFVCPRLFWLAPLGLFLGQIMYMNIMYHPAGLIIMPSWLGVPFFSAIPAFVGAGVSFGLVKLIAGILGSRKRNDA